jgi:hypothetical protein
MKKVSAIITLIMFLFILFSTALSQGNQAIVLMKADSQVGSCEGTTEINYKTVFGAKFNNNDDIRLLANPGYVSDASGVTRDNYEDAAKNKLANLFELKWQDNVLYALTTKGQTPLLLLPEDMKPARDANPQLSSFYAGLFSGEAHDGKQKTKLTLASRDIWKIYFIGEGGNINDVLFNHASEEKSVTLWEAFLRKSNNYRLDEANGDMRNVLIGCAQTAIDTFAGGEYKAIDVAQGRAERARSVKSDEWTDKLLADINQRKEKVAASRAEVSKFLSAGKWDDAITAAEPVKIYLASFNDTNSFYNQALKQSHDQHLGNGKQALETRQLETGLQECSLAWNRLPDSTPAHECVCSSRNQIALRDSAKLRGDRQPKDAKELVEKQLADSQCRPDRTVLAELDTAKREYAQQLFEEAKQLIAVPTPGELTAATGTGAATVTPVKATLRTGTGASTAARPPVKTTAPAAVAPIASAPPAEIKLKQLTAQNKQDFRTAREKLMLAQEMSPVAAAGTLLNRANQALSGYCVAEAQKATQRGDAATAYVYLMSARGYTPETANVDDLLRQAHTQFEDKTHVSVGVVFNNQADSRYGASVINEVSSEVEAAISQSGIAQVVLLDKYQAMNALRSIQAGANLPSPTAIISGDLLNASIGANYNDRTVRSYYTVDNPVWKERDRIHDQIVDEYKGCKRVNGEAACTAQEKKMQDWKRYRDSVPSELKEYYDYYERDFTVSGAAKLTFNYIDSISRNTRTTDPFASYVNDQCTARNGVDSRDTYAPKNTDCNIQDESAYIYAMANQIKASARSQATSFLQDLPLSYYTRGKNAGNKQQGVEDCLRFLFLTGAKTSYEAEDAKKMLLEYDAELATDGLLR